MSMGKLESLKVSDVGNRALNLGNFLKITSKQFIEVPISKFIKAF
jgi:hypothetical protein